MLSLRKIGHAIEILASVNSNSVPVNIGQLLYEGEQLWHDLHLEVPGLLAPFANGNILLRQSVFLGAPHWFEHAVLADAL